MTFRTRFAPSPTGPLHLGHAYSACLAQDLALEQGGEFHLRIEDIDQSRARQVWEDQIYDDLRWLGLSWVTPVIRQSDHMTNYAQALDSLWLLGVLYPCSCNRKDIAQAASAPQEGVQTHGPDGLIYPGTCRHQHDRSGTRPKDQALRLDMSAAMQRLPKVLSYEETGRGRVDIQTKSLRTTVGDVVLARRDMLTSYHLSVVLDDARQNMTHVVRGEDLADATQIHVVLQHLLGLAVPVYHHHRLIRDEHGKRLAKRDDARAISKYRTDGLTPQDVRQLVGLSR